MKTLRSEWASYEREVLPRDASPIQRQECRRAFYAGAAAFDNARYAAGDKAGELVVELARFNEAVSRGEA